MRLPKCKFCKEHDMTSKYGSTVEIAHETWTTTAYVRCSCGMEVRISIPIYGGQTRKELDKKEREIKSYVASIWTAINV